MRTNWQFLNEGKAWRQCQHVCCDSQWPWLQGPTTVTTAATSQLPKSQSTKLNKTKCSQFWMERSCFQEKSSWKFIFYVVCVWKCVLPEVPQKHSPVLHHSAPKVAGGFGSGEREGTTFSPHSLHLLLQTSFSFFSTTTTCCLLQRSWNFMSSCSIHPLFYQVSCAPSFNLSS